jgi:hypothetical protein
VLLYDLKRWADRTVEVRSAALQGMFFGSSAASRCLSPAYPTARVGLSSTVVAGLLETTGKSADAEARRISPADRPLAGPPPIPAAPNPSPSDQAGMG